MLAMSTSSRETRENSDSDSAGSLGGRSISDEASPGPGDMGCDGCVPSDSSGSPTKQMRVLISSTTFSVSTSSGTRVERADAGMFIVALREVAGGI